MARMGSHSTIFQMAGVVRWRQHILAVIGAGVVAAVVSWGRLEPITVLDSSITPSARPGGFVQVERAVKWNRSDCWSYVASTSLVDALKYNHEVEARFLGLPDYGTLSNREWPVPFTMPWGATKLHTRLSFSCFPFFEVWPVIVDLPELVFDVSPPR
jgi:hypothetical protein